MKLSTDDAALYYKLTWPLQFYVNQQLKILPRASTLEAYIECDYEDKLKVRNALYEHIELIDAFLNENPAQFTPAEIALARHWKNFVAGDFYIERFLSKGAILIRGQEPPQVYLVLGLMEGIEEMLGKYYPLPLMIKTVLLPFKGQIIYDGLLQSYNVFFGGGIKGSLKETYLTAKQNGRIIQSLDQPPSRDRARRKPMRDWEAELEELVKAVNRFKGDKTPILSETFTLLKASTAMAQAAADDPDDLEALWKLFKRVSRAERQLETALYRAEQ
jgi:hypothetical protein